MQKNNYKHNNVVQNEDCKQMAELYYNMYTSCIKYKKEKERTNNDLSKKISCKTYLDKFNYFSKKCNDDELYK